jgi:hypothetical protein
MSNETARHRRNDLRVALRARERDKAALLQKRENDVHSVDERALADVAHAIGFLAAQLQAAGGSLSNLDFEE